MESLTNPRCPEEERLSEADVRHLAGVVPETPVALAMEVPAGEQVPPRVMTVEELASFLRVNHKTVRDAIARGEIPGVRRIGTTIRIHTDTMLGWLAKGQERVSRSKRSR